MAKKKMRDHEASSSPPPEAPQYPDPLEWSSVLAKVAEQSQRVVAEFLRRDGSIGTTDLKSISHAYLELAQRMMRNPAQLLQSQLNLWQDYLNLWQNSTRRFFGNEVAPVIETAKDDKRFRDQAWNESVIFDFIKQSYLLTARWIQSNVHSVEGMDAKTTQKIAFFTRQFVDAMAPSNFVMTNPQVLRATLDSRGENLLKGLKNLLADLERSKRGMTINMTDLEAFRVGDNIAITPGKVIFQNELMQLIQYEPSTKTVHERPLLIIPPWINKFYVLDLREQNSFVRWCVSQGFTTFIISWVNPDATLAAKGFEDYMLEGPLAALKAIESATGSHDINAVGYCLGGTLLASTIAYLAATHDKRIKSATFLATMVDFSNAGDLAVFIDEEQLTALENRMRNQGYLEGEAMGTTFSMLRDNDLIWSFVVSNYLLGNDPFPFDLLYWNADTTRMPAAMHSFYLRKMYHENKLVVPGGISLAGAPIDLRKIDIPCFLMASKEDHIAPWQSTYAATQIYQGDLQFVLSASGHIAGVANPPEAHKYCYWTNKELPLSPEEWFANAEQHPGSWWLEWHGFITRHGGEQVSARIPGDGNLAPLEQAPGSYVMVKAA